MIKDVRKILPIFDHPPPLSAGVRIEPTPPLSRPYASVRQTLYCVVNFHTLPGKIFRNILQLDHFLDVGTKFWMLATLT